MPASSYAINTVKRGGDGNQWEVVVDDYSRFEWKKVVSLSVTSQIMRTMSTVMMRQSEVLMDIFYFIENPP